MEKLNFGSMSCMGGVKMTGGISADYKIEMTETIERRSTGRYRAKDGAG